MHTHSSTPPHILFANQLNIVYNYAIFYHIIFISQISTDGEFWIFVRVCSLIAGIRVRFLLSRFDIIRGGSLSRWGVVGCRLWAVSSLGLERGGLGGWVLRCGVYGRCFGACIDCIIFCDRSSNRQCTVYHVLNIFEVY